MTEDRPSPAARALSGRTAWARSLQTPLRVFLRTETGSAAVLVAMTVAALVWINISASSYEAVWGARLSVRLAGAGVSLDLREWVNSGLMTFFFFVFGLEARREFDMGELRQRRRLALPVLAGLGGLIVPVGIYLAFNHGPAARGWGAAMSTDTAFALGMLALVRPGFPDRVRAFLLSVAVVDDLVSLVVIGAAYSRYIRLVPLAVAAGVFAVVLVLQAHPDPQWPHLRAAGDHGVGRGPALGHRPGRGRPGHGPADLRLPRRADRSGTGQRPVPQLPRAAHPRTGPVSQRRAHLRPVPERAAPAPLPSLDQLRHRPAVRAGQRRDRAQRQFPGPRVRLPDHAGHPDRVRGRQTRRDRWRVLAAHPAQPGPARPPVGWAAVAGVGTIAGIGFTVSILIATLAFGGTQLQEAKLGVLSTTLGASLVTWLVFRATALLPARLQIRALLGTTQALVDLGAPVDPGRDHIRGPDQAIVTIVEYGDFECPYCGQAEPVLRELLAGHGDVRYVWRHLPLNDVHPHAQLAAEAAEAAAGQGAFWAMHDLLLSHQDALLMPDLIRYATEAGLDPGRFRDQLASRAGAARVAEDVDSADLSGVSGTPTFFINGRRHYGSYDIARADHGRPGREGRQPGFPPPSRSAARFLSRDLPRRFDRLLMVRREAWSAIV